MEMAVTNSATKSPKGEPDRTAIQVLPIKALPFSNGVLKRQNPQSHHHRHHLSSVVNSTVVSYKECVKNHAASLGTHALDGCGEFMPSPSATSSDPTFFKCTASGCHLNFHHRELDDSYPAFTTHVIEYQPHTTATTHRSQLVRVQILHCLHRSPPPTTIQLPTCFWLYRQGCLLLRKVHRRLTGVQTGGSNSEPDSLRTRKRKYISLQKVWDGGCRREMKKWFQEFCNEIGIDKGVLKVWMHNNKNSSSKKDVNGRTNIPELHNSNIGG